MNLNTPKFSVIIIVRFYEWAKSSYQFLLLLIIQFIYNLGALLECRC